MDFTTVWKHKGFDIGVMRTPTIIGYAYRIDHPDLFLLRFSTISEAAEAVDKYVYGKGGRPIMKGGEKMIHKIAMFGCRECGCMTPFKSITGPDFITLSAMVRQNTITERCSNPECENDVQVKELVEIEIDLNKPFT